jgi:hypothetical protein
MRIQKVVVLPKQRVVSSPLPHAPHAGEGAERSEAGEGSRALTLTVASLSRWAPPSPASGRGA